MENKQTTKEMTGREPGVKNKRMKQQFHFGGEGKYKPQSIEAESIKEATKIYEDIRKKI